MSWYDLQKEYVEFMAEVKKACQDVNKAFKKLHPENINRFKKDIGEIVSLELIKLINTFNS